MLEPANVRDLFVEEVVRDEDFDMFVKGNIIRDRTFRDYDNKLGIGSILFNNKKDIRWTDMGCGHGNTLKQAKKKWVYGLGLARTNRIRAIGVDQMRETEYKDKVYFIKGDIRKIKLKEKQDLITAYDVLQYTQPREAETLKHWHSLLADDGLIILGTDLPPRSRLFEQWLKDSGLKGTVQTDRMIIYKN